MNELVGKKVIVYSDASGTEKQDVGTLESLDSVWVRLRKSDIEVLFFSIHRIRMIKPFDAH